MLIASLRRPWLAPVIDDRSGMCRKNPDLTRQVQVGSEKNVEWGRGVRVRTLSTYVVLHRSRNVKSSKRAFERRTVPAPQIGGVASSGTWPVGRGGGQPFRPATA